jgi:tetratricopeptide (TPR) repeat protein
MLLLRPTNARICERRSQAAAQSALLAGGAALARLARATFVVGFALAIAACGSAPTAPDRATSSASSSGEDAGSQKSGTSGTAAGARGGSAASGATAEGAVPSAAGGATSGTANLSAPVEIPKRALSDFERAVGLMRSGNSGEAELEFKTLAAGYPQLVGAQINLALLQRKANRLDEAQLTLKSAVEKNPNSAAAWNELGLTHRMRGQFQDAAAAYEKALAADANFAAAHRNYAVLLDLYLGDPEHALTELERYKELTGEDKPVTGWIAELRQRTGKPAAPRPAATPATPAEAPTETEAAPAPPAAQPPTGRG